MSSVKEGFLIFLGARIAFLRKERKMSQLKLALECGVSKSYLSDLERGRRNPSAFTLRRIALALKIDPGKLLEGL